jgi:ribonuclease III
LYSALIEALGITVDTDLINLALTHRSFAYESGGIPTNERLEFLGDSVLGLVVTKELYEQLPDMDESRLSPLRSGVVNTKALAQIARELNIGKFLRIGKGEESSGGREKNSILADALEALVGAIYLEHGFDVTTKIILKWFRPVIKSAMDQGMGIDGKTALQELISAKNLGLLEYQVSETGPDHDKNFSAEVIVGGEPIASGSGKSKRDAEQAAARAALTKLNA